MNSQLGISSVKLYHSGENDNVFILLEARCGPCEVLFLYFKPAKFSCSAGYIDKRAM